MEREASASTEQRVKNERNRMPFMSEGQQANADVWSGIVCRPSQSVGGGRRSGKKEESLAHRHWDFWFWKIGISGPCGVTCCEA